MKRKGAKYRKRRVAYAEKERSKQRKGGKEVRKKNREKGGKIKIRVNEENRKANESRQIKEKTER